MRCDIPIDRETSRKSPRKPTGAEDDGGERISKRIEFRHVDSASATSANAAVLVLDRSRANSILFEYRFENAEFLGLGDRLGVQAGVDDLVDEFGILEG